MTRNALSAALGQRTWKVLFIDNVSTHFANALVIKLINYAPPKKIYIYIIHAVPFHPHCLEEKVQAQTAHPSRLPAGLAGLAIDRKRPACFVCWVAAGATAGIF